MDDIDLLLAKTLTVILGRPVTPDEAVLRINEENWDSYCHIEIVLTVEQAFGISFEETEMETIDGSETLKSLIKRRSYVA